MTEYRILRDSSPENLETKVKDHLAFGWKLQGGVTVSLVGYEHESCGNREDYDDQIYAQAVTHETPQES